jgi:putative addiction module killer protein
MLKIRQTATFLKWESSLRDQKARTIIAARIDRLASGLAGDAKAVGEGVMELRVRYGPGYRIYFVRHGGEIIVLLCDIETARRLAKEIEE